MSKAYVFTRHGGPETQALIDVDRPAPGPGELLIAVRAAGVNPVDWKLRTGLRRPGDTGERVFPVVLGSEASGVVTALGEGVTGFAVGDEVFGATLTGGYAEETILPAAITAHKPAALSFADAATLPVAAATAYDGVHQLALPAGATLLITGAGGGVGVAAVQIAHSLGLKVVGVASAAKKEFVESLGAVHVESGDGWTDRVPGPVDAVYDLVGGDALEQAAGFVSGPGKLITAGEPEDVVAALGGTRVVRARSAAVLDAVAALVVRGDLNPYVTARYPLERAVEALRAVEEGHARGKVVIEIEDAR
ncbi:NADP-dependent oxidoreductase [Streptomyces acidiscabies]|uniref:NADP-dependent oxidoreductase n=1 Tax=Streptomyces acidiscabies TaxID=42234 RepID=UPI0038F730D9